MILVFTAALAACGRTAQNSSTAQSGSTGTTGSAAGNAADSTSDGKQNTGSGKTLVVYFSCTGNTKGAAETIAQVTGGELYAITPSQPYTDADLNYNDKSSRSTTEQNDKSARPGIDGSIDSWAQYGTVYVGYPVWWGEEPRIMDTFAEKYDFTGKTVIPFCTSGSSDIGQSGSNLAKLAGGSGRWLDGKRLATGASTGDVTDWISSLGLD